MGTHTRSPTLPHTFPYTPGSTQTSTTMPKTMKFLATTFSVLLCTTGVLATVPACLSKAVAEFENSDVHDPYFDPSWYPKDGDRVYAKYDDQYVRKAFKAFVRARLAECTTCPYTSFYIPGDRSSAHPRQGGAVGEKASEVAKDLDEDLMDNFGAC